MAENTGASKTSKLEKARKNFTRFFKDIRTELKKVIWPTRQQLFNNTVTVLLTCLVVGAIIWIADEILMKIVEWTLK
jgi:preprotein translocase, SecE subunit, bacterial